MSARRRWCAPRSTIPSDSFSLIRIDGDDLSGNPFRLVEEANTIPMFGGRRAIWVRAGGRNIAPAVEAVIAAPSPDCRVVIEAGDLRKNAPLRSLCESAKNAAAIGCYSDGERDIERLIEDELKKAGLTIAPEARAALVPFLGGDRQASRNELQKLALYVHGRDRVTTDDVMAVVADASAVALDNVVDAAFAGKPAEVETQYAQGARRGNASRRHRLRRLAPCLEPAPDAHRGRGRPVGDRRGRGRAPANSFPQKARHRYGVAGLDHLETARRDVVVVRRAAGNAAQAASRRRDRAAIDDDARDRGEAQVELIELFAAGFQRAADRRRACSGARP